MKRITMAGLFISGIIFFFQGELLAAWGCGDGSYGYRGHHFLDGNILGGGIGMFIIILIFIVIAGFFAVKYYKSANGNSILSNGEGAIDILKKRLAKGEIDGDEFEKMKKLL